MHAKRFRPFCVGGPYRSQPPAIEYCYDICGRYKNRISVHLFRDSYRVVVRSVSNDVKWRVNFQTTYKSNGGNRDRLIISKIRSFRVTCEPDE